MGGFEDFAGLATAGIVGLLFGFIMWVGLTLLAIWITYTIIWRAVRRGLREFHGTAQRAQIPPDY